jgi:hypothetical protein
MAILGQITNATVTLSDRMQYGFITIAELCVLKQCGRTQVYEDIKAGALEVVKHGRSTRVFGPAAAAYVPGQRRARVEAA